MSNLRATLRLQIHNEFTLYDACEHIDYYHSLGISHLYLSPLFESRHGSNHGYDTIDYNRISQERGGEPGLLALSHAAHTRNMGLILDIVPNHMAVGSENKWWQDVLTWGRSSDYASFFDIDWDATQHRPENTILLPFLDRPYGLALNDGLLTLFYNEEKEYFYIQHHEHCFPICPDHLPLPSKNDVGAEKWYNSIQSTLDVYNDNATDLHNLLEKQNYRLAWWRVADETINWRRFFNITELVALNIQNDFVFDTVHSYALTLYEQGVIDGFRVDHIDGLAQPGYYCQRLREEMAKRKAVRPSSSPEAPILYVEKILEPEEKLPPTWQVTGTTGYDFLEEISLLLHDNSGEKALESLWKEVAPSWSDYATESQNARIEVAESLLCGATDNLIDHLYRLTRQDITLRDFTKREVRLIVIKLLSLIRIYRTYNADEFGKNRSLSAHSGNQNIFLEQAHKELKTKIPSRLSPLLNWLNEKLAGKGDDWKRVQAFEHLSAPLAAKAIEDTVFYRYGRLLSRNDVGTDPAQFSISSTQFHQAMQSRKTNSPQSMLTTATHDHKRGEDARARLAVLSSLSSEWREAVSRWSTLNKVHRGKNGPDSRDELILYQTLLGTWPLEQTIPDASFKKRILGWQIKAIREAKRHGSWTDPDKDYEADCTAFIEKILTHEPFLADFTLFFQKIAPAGALNSLAQTVLRFTVPGVADTYQGTEWWDFSLVDPDNRQAVDYKSRKKALLRHESFSQTAQHWKDGIIKQILIQKILKFRQNFPELFSEGDYIPITLKPIFKNSLFCFSRQEGNNKTLVLVPKHGFLLKPESIDLSTLDYVKTNDEIIENTEHEWKSILWNNVKITKDGTLAIPDSCRYFPIDILIPSAQIS
ncbi:maltooligosyl trehalose synthase [Acetobacter senegalensis]|uniref:Maltooligosyl trehalose synthase n=1 Tax=Acetobacter senegalensis TaxID=446692 RepID=A0A0U5BE49_9PROT|nr:malto-oligosyltrehalose synthase [Acetobacter senegalensis]CEF42803.1 maltooligosyl trehalose synthase [Acetobacter senegalensis]